MNKNFKDCVDKLKKELSNKEVPYNEQVNMLISFDFIINTFMEIKKDTRYSDITKCFGQSLYVVYRLRVYDIGLDLKWIASMIPEELNDGVPETLSEFYIKSIEELLKSYTPYGLITDMEYEKKKRTDK